MPFEARLVLLNGPPGAGKTTLAARLKERFAATGRLAVVEHDDFALMAGAPAAGAASERVSTARLHALAAAALAFAQGGVSVLVVVNYGRARKELLEQLVGPAPVQQVLLLPPWEVCQARVLDRLGSGTTSQPRDAVRGHVGGSVPPHVLPTGHVVPTRGTYARDRTAPVRASRHLRSHVRASRGV